MGSFLLLVFAYVFGGLTFIPLLLLAILGHAYYTLPVVDPVAERQKQDKILHTVPDSQPDLSSLPVELRKRDREQDAAAGYFAISRDYVSGGVNGKPPERLTPTGEVLAVESPSVYQSMYRSIFERGKAQGPSFESTGGNVKATKKARNVFYVVLRLGHLMLYDNAEQLEVRHVISLGLYEVDVYSGGEIVPEGELWVRRNCIQLRRRETDYTLRDSKPYYLFSDNCSEKEDFFHALIQNQHRSSTSPQTPVVPLRFESEHMVKLVQQLHASEELMQTRWFNALLGRLFLSLYKTTAVHSFIHKKIMKKIARIQKPSFIEQIKVGKIDMGTAAPLFTNPKLRELTLDGELIIETDVKYSGNFRLEIAAAVLIDLGKRFNVRRIDVLLAGICKSLEGHLLIKVKPPPSNRLWISFETMPKLDLSIEPIISSRQITYSIILRTIESRIREVMGETLVYPNWDDIPFSHTENDAIRGGLWDFHAANYKPPTAESEDQTEEEAKIDTEALQKSQSTPSLIRRRPVGTTIKDKAKTWKDGVDSVSLSSGRESPSASSKPKVIRSASFASASPPIVSMSPEHASAFRDDGQFSLPDAATAMKGLSSHTSSTSSTPPAEAQALDILAEADDQADLKDGEEHDMFDMEMPADDAPRRSREHNHSRRNGSRSSINIEGFGTPNLPDNDGKIKSLAANAQLATAAARKWGLDVLAKRASHAGSNDSTSDLSITPNAQSMPIGRGQPLPPPGQPLPGPPNQFRKTWTTALGSIGRKKVPNSPSIMSLSTEGRDAAMAAASQAAEATPPLPPRPSTESAMATALALESSQSRKGSAHSRRGSTRTQRLSTDRHASDDVLVIKAPALDSEGQGTGGEEKHTLNLLGDNPHDEQDDVTKNGELTANGQADLHAPLEGSNFEPGSKAAAGAYKNELKIIGEDVVGTSDTKESDQESLERLQTFVY
jgi:hypothetical protein